MLIQITQPEQNNTNIWLSFHNKPDDIDVQKYQMIKPEYSHIQTLQVCTTKKLFNLKVMTNINGSV